MTSGYAPLRHGIGIHSGEAVAANIGSPNRLSYALVGDTVNIASRLQGLNKVYGTEVIISGATKERLNGDFSLTQLPDTALKGIVRPISLCIRFSGGGSGYGPDASGAFLFSNRIDPLVQLHHLLDQVQSQTRYSSKPTVRDAEVRKTCRRSFSCA